MIMCINHPNRPASNKKYELCPECMYIKKNGKSRSEVYAERAANKPKKVYDLKRTPIIPKKRYRLELSEKGKEKQKKVSEAKSKSGSEDRFGECLGCGKWKALDHSHILSVKQREDLADNPDNIQDLCRSCHSDWESWSAIKLVQLRCFESNMKFVETHDNGKFWRYLHKIIEHINKQSTSNLVLEMVKQMYLYYLIESHLQNG